MSSRCDDSVRGNRDIQAATFAGLCGLKQLCRHFCFRSSQFKFSSSAFWPLGWYGFRHTFATTLVQSGIDLYKVQQLLGHKSPIMTQRYADHYPESLRDGVEILDRRRAGSTKVAQSAGHDPGVNCVSI